MEIVLRVVLSFIAGGVTVSGLVWLSERLGARVGGVLSGVPSTMLVSLVFIYVGQGGEDVKLAVSVVPPLMIAALVYGYALVTTLGRAGGPYLYARAIATAGLVWLLVAFAARRVEHYVSFAESVAAVMVAIVGFAVLFRRYEPVVAKHIQRPRHVLIDRFMLSGAVIAGAVMVAHVVSAKWGGVVASFPVVLTSTVCFLNSGQGNGFAKSWIKHLPFAYIGLLIFAVIVYQTVAVFDPLVSFGLGVVCSILYSYMYISFGGLLDKNKDTGDRA